MNHDCVSAKHDREKYGTNIGRVARIYLRHWRSFLAHFRFDLLPRFSLFSVFCYYFIYSPKDRIDETELMRMWNNCHTRTEHSRAFQSVPSSSSFSFFFLFAAEAIKVTLLLNFKINVRFSVACIFVRHEHIRLSMANKRKKRISEAEKASTTQ